MCCPLHVLQARDVSLVVWHLGRYAHVPIIYYGSNYTEEYSYTLIARGLQSVVGHAVAPKLPRAGRWELPPRDAW
jgi:hypothetical protein